MALGTITVTSQTVKAASAPIQAVLLSFPGDGAYPTGGTTGFRALVRAALARQVNIIGVFMADKCGGYIPLYDVANDTLMVLQGDYSESADGPLVEVAATGDLSATTFKVNVLCY